ncbi:MAG: inorganic pyrophosphatase [Anaerolineae bacterium]|nr:inorganic pyrophosphatase [Anaerolineae bacterium]
MGLGQHFWAYLDKLVSTSEIVLDRPRGSQHPRYPAIVYPLDYGYLKKTRSGDGDGTDVWVGSGGQGEITGVVCSVDLAQRDTEIKILLGCTADDIDIIADFHNRGDQAAIVIRPAH